MRTIGVVGKGGSGKTTLSINLACALGHLGKRVALLDMNLTTSHLAIELGILPHTTLNDHVVNGERLEDAMYPQFNIFTIPSTLNIFNPERADMSGIRESIKESLHDFEIGILDSPSGLGREALATIGASDEVIVVAEPTSTSVADAVKLRHIAERSGSKPLGVVINKVVGKWFELTQEEVSEIVGLPVLGSIKSDESFLRSQVYKRPLVFGKRRGSEEFFKIACSITGQVYSKSLLF